MPLWLVGMMGTGKSAVGRRLAARREIRFVDTDALIEAGAGKEIGEIWRQEGEEGFRWRERQALASIETDPEVIIATGGGAVLDSDNVALMRKTGTVVWLDADPSTLATRVGQGRSRPLLADSDPGIRLLELAEERRSAYEAAAHHRVVNDGRSLDEIVAEVEATWADHDR